MFIRHFKAFLQEEEASGLRNASLLHMARLHRAHVEMLTSPIKTARQVRAPGRRTGLQRGMLGRVCCSEAQGAQGSQPLPPDDQAGIARAGGEGALSEGGLGVVCRKDDARLPTVKTLRSGEKSQAQRWPQPGGQHSHLPPHSGAWSFFDG